MTRSVRLPLALIIGAALVACGATSAPTATPISGDTTNPVIAATNPPPTVEPTPDKVAAIVNGTTIPLAILDRQIERRLAGIAAVGDPQPQDMAAFRLTELNAIIEQTVIEQAAAIQGLTVTDAELQTEIDSNITTAGGRDQWLQQLTENNLTEPEYRSAVRSALITARMRDVVTKNACVNVEQIRARHILVASEATAANIKTQLDGGGDFIQLALDYSLDVTTRQAGGDLGWFARGQLLQPGIEEFAFSAPLNQTSTPIKTELGYHIIQVLERVKDRPVDAETCYRLTESAFEKWLAELMQAAKIERYPEGR